MQPDGAGHSCSGSHIPSGTPGGIEIASAAFKTVIPGFGPVLAVIVALLAYKTTIAMANVHGDDSSGKDDGGVVFRIGFLSALAIFPDASTGAIAHRLTEALSGSRRDSGRAGQWGIKKC